jgi:hypothetical protein
MAPRHKNLRSIIDYIITRQNSGLKFQDAKVFRGLTVGSDHYLVNEKILFSYGRNIANESREIKPMVNWNCYNRQNII